MAVRAVQISIDEKLLRAVDADAETKRRGRSAVVRAALELYLEARRRRAVDDRIRKAFSAVKRDPDLDLLIEAQSWPDD